MASVIDKTWLRVCLDVRVWVDALDPALQEAAAEGGPRVQSVEEVIANEVRSNLDSVGYVRHEFVQLRRIDMVVKILPTERNSPQGKLADAELHFVEGELSGLKLLGFAVWERRGGSGRNVTFPAKNYTTNGEKRSFSLLRPVADIEGHDRVRDLILSAYAEHEAKAAS